MGLLQKQTHFGEVTHLLCVLLFDALCYMWTLPLEKKKKDIIRCNFLILDQTYKEPKQIFLNYNLPSLWYVINNRRWTKKPWGRSKTMCHSSVTLSWCTSPPVPRGSPEYILQVLLAKRISEVHHSTGTNGDGKGRARASPYHHNDHMALPTFKNTFT